MQACVSRCARTWLSLTLSRRAARMANSPGGGDAASRATAYPRLLREDADDAYPRYREYALSLPVSYSRKPVGRDDGSISGTGRPAPRRPPLSFDFGSGGVEHEGGGVLVTVSPGGAAGMPRPYKYASAADDWEVTRTAVVGVRHAPRSESPPSAAASPAPAARANSPPHSASISPSLPLLSSPEDVRHEDKALIGHESGRPTGMASLNRDNRAVAVDKSEREDEVSGMSTFVRGSDNTRDCEEDGEAMCSKATPTSANRRGGDSPFFACDMRTDSRRPPRGTPPRCESFIGGDAESSCHAGKGVARLRFGDCSAAATPRRPNQDAHHGLSPGFEPPIGLVGGCGLLDSNLTPVKWTGASPAATLQRARDGVPLLEGGTTLSLAPGEHQAEEEQPQREEEGAGRRVRGENRGEMQWAKGGRGAPCAAERDRQHPRKDEIVSKDGGELDVMERIVDAFQKAKCEYDEMVRVLEEEGMGGRRGSGGGARGAALRMKCDAWEAERDERRADVIKVAERISELKAAGPYA